jgi:hypothetical protein
MWEPAHQCARCDKAGKTEEGEYYHLVTAWKATQQEEQVTCPGI